MKRRIRIFAILAVIATGGLFLSSCGSSSSNPNLTWDSGNWDDKVWQ